MNTWKGAEQRRGYCLLLYYLGGIADLVCAVSPHTYLSDLREQQGKLSRETKLRGFFWITELCGCYFFCCVFIESPGVNVQVYGLSLTVLERHVINGRTKSHQIICFPHSLPKF